MAGVVDTDNTIVGLEQEITLLVTAAMVAVGLVVLPAKLLVAVLVQPLVASVTVTLYVPV